MTSASHAEGRQFDPGQLYLAACLRVRPKGPSKGTLAEDVLGQEQIKDPTRGQGEKETARQRYAVRLLVSPTGLLLETSHGERKVRPERFELPTF